MVAGETADISANSDEDVAGAVGTEIVVGVDAVKGAGVAAHLGAGVVERGASIVESVSACVIEGLAAGIGCIASGVLIL